MKKALFCLAFCAMAVAAWSQNTVAEAADSASAPIIKFDTHFHNFDTIKYRGKAEYDFRFTNVGKSPLIIKNCAPSCGCTIPKWPKEAIKPGESGVITVIYNNTMFASSFDKSVSVLSNAINNSETLIITGVVLPAEKTNSSKK